MATTASGISLPDQQSNLEGLPNSLASLTLQNDGGQSDNSDEKPKPDSPPRPLKIYTPQQLLFLYESPLVQVPNGMPDLKDWFGTENEQNMNKKESETILPVSSARRHRRDPEDDTTARPSFRSALTQPSQMGNFKHQSLRAPDRDRDTRDFRDKEGHEHLRNVPLDWSAKQQGQLLPGAPKEGKVRGGVATVMTGGEEVTGIREMTGQILLAEIGMTVSGLARVYATLLDLGEIHLLVVVIETKPETETTVHWTVGIVMTTDATTTAIQNTTTLGVGEMMKPRDRKVNGDDKDRDDRREREKEKEPAWMDTYIPSPSSGGIMGGNADEIDGIQAWKKDMKEKQEKEKSALQAAADDAPAPSLPPAPSANGMGGASNGLDEIQMFRMLMKKEDEKKKQVEAPDMVDAKTGPPIPPPPTNDSEKPVASVKPSPIISVTNNDGPNTLLTMLTQTTTTSQSITVLESSISTPPGLSDQNKPPTSRLFPIPQATSTKPSEPTALPSHQLNPHPGSRLLAFGAPSNPVPKPHSPMSPSSLDPPMVANPHSASPAHGINAAMPKPELRPQQGFSPFEEGAAGGNPMLQGSEGFASYSQMGQSMRRVSGERAPPIPSENGLHMESSLPNDTANVALASSKGSRFAKFFDGNKNRDPVNARAQPSSGSPIGPSGGIRHDDHLVGNNGINVNDNRAMAEIFNMLSNSAQGRSLNGIHQPPSAMNGGHTSYGQPAQHTHSPLQMLGQQHPHQQQPLMHGNARLDSLYDSRLDDRSFVPDGMVPGLRNAPLPRGHDNGGMFPDAMDELHFARQQRMPLQQRVPEQMFPGQVPMFSQQPGRNAGIPIQQQPFRGGPSPISLQNQLQNQLPNHGQRLPPGLANLGGRPPHEPNQFMGNMQQNSALLNALQGSHLGQPTFNNLPNSNNLGFGPPMRGPPGHSPIQANLPHNNVGLGHPNNMDMRIPSQAQLMGLAGGGVRGFNPQQGPGQLPLLGMRQQPPILPPHMAQGGMPAHLQQQPNNPQNHDLMALLMGGPHRE
ncbi:hypothetical protein PC9H_003817 [Pleurotus ostreatus]|uniref:Uncharacterized protein n=1 Tax=Pleurotus ostreatus TaxID=5322 RepID=A0A8H6ZZT2_PLEOS|nr:uncharacterized protein PC9H_003817 [Pleurotus ostreatus]KAF7436983.1 hypothetical protein PC9H_003817 [Pleurotus ostreatus]